MTTAAAVGEGELKFEAERNRFHVALYCDQRLSRMNAAMLRNLLKDCNALLYAKHSELIADKTGVSLTLLLRYEKAGIIQHVGYGWWKFSRDYPERVFSEVEDPTRQRVRLRGKGWRHTLRREARADDDLRKR